MRKLKYFNLTILAFMIAITAILMYTPLGTISLGVVSITIAHIPILILAIVLGLKSGLIMGLSFGVISMIGALLFPRGPLDPLFINPLVSILPRLLIPITTYYVYKIISKKNNAVAVAVAAAVGNLTNTIAVYTSLFLLYNDKVEDIMGKNFITVIIGLISTSTLIKTILVVVITTPVILALQRYIMKDNPHKKKNKTN